MLAATVTFSGGLLKVVGDGANDNIQVVGNSTYTGFDLTVNGTPEGFYNYSSVSRVQVLSGGGNDTINNTSFAISQFNGGPGNDRIYGGWSRDFIVGGSGNDLIVGRNGNDRLFGNDGIDRLFGSSDNDSLNGGNGNDFLYGGAGNDFIGGLNGDDYLNGQSGNDTLFGNAGEDNLLGGAGNDTLRGGIGDDSLSGDSGDDDLYGEGGLDTLDGGYGKDGLAGGIDGVADILHAREGLGPAYNDQADRLLIEYELDPGGFAQIDTVYGESHDAQIRVYNSPAVDFGDFVYSAGTWTDSDLQDVDSALKILHMETPGAELLSEGDLVDGFMTLGRLGSRISGTTGAFGVNAGGNMWLTEDAFSSSNGIDELRATVIHEIAHNFDAAPHNPLIEDFRDLSGWTLTSVGWGYSSNAQFTNPNANRNPFEDFAYSFETYFMNKYFANPLNDNLVADKLASVEDFLDSF